MQRFVYTILARGTGLALRDALVTIYVGGTTELAELYSENDLSSEELLNPLVSNAFGEIAAYIPNGRYDLQVDFGGQPTRLIPDIQVFDAAEFDIQVGPLARITGGANELAFFAGTNIASVIPFTQLARDLVEISDPELLLAFLGLGTVGYSVPFGFVSPPLGAETLLIHVFAEAVTFADNFAGAQGSIGINPTATTVLDVYKNGVGVGTISVSTGGVATFATLGAELSFAVGDRMRVDGPAVADLTIANSAFTFIGGRD
jgi:hypothetical protein